MVLVDTSVWIDFFQSSHGDVAARLDSLIRDHNRVVLCGIVLQEILQGIRHPKSFEEVRERLLKFPYIETDRDTWLLAASLYRKLRSNGRTLPPVDLTIAALAISNSLTLFTKDSHFDAVAEISGLRLFEG